MRIRGVIVCAHSWNDTEREAICDDEIAVQLPIIRCPGCTDCDLAARKAGTLKDLLPITSLIKSLNPPIATQK